MKLLLHILKYKLIALFMIRPDLTPKAVAKNLAAALIYFLFAYGAYKVTYASLYFVLHDIRLDVYLFHRFIAILLFMFFLSVNVGNVLVSVNGLYRGSEVNYLFTKPIPFENIFVLKFLENFFYSSGTLFVILFAVLYAYAKYFSLPVFFYLFATFGLFLPFTLIAGLLGIMILFALIQIAQKIGTQTTIIILIGFYLLLLILFFASNDPTAIIMKVVQNRNYMISVSDRFDTPAMQMLPNYSVTYGMYWFVRGNSSMAFQYSALLILEAVFFFVLCYQMAKRIYYKTYVLSSEIQFRKTRKNEINLPFQISFDKYRSKYIVAETLIRKELALFFREPAQVIHLLFMLFLMFLFLFGLRDRPNDMFKSLNPGTQTVIYMALLLFNFFLINSLSLRFIFPHMSLEGEAYWKLRSAPVDIKKVFRAKFIVLFLLIGILAQVLNYYSHLRFSGVLLIFSTVTTFFVSLAMVGINFALGCYYVNYKEKNPIRIASSQGASTAFLLCLLYMGFVIAMIFPAMFDYFLLTQNQKQIIGLGYFSWSFLKVIPLSIVIIWFTFRLSMQQVAGDLKN